MDINGMLASMGALTAESNKRIEAGTEQLRADSANIRNLSELNLQDGAKSLEAIKAASDEKLTTEFVRNSARERAQAIAGLDPNQLENEYTRSLAKLTTAQTEREKVFDQYGKLASINFFDDPVGYIFAQMDMPTVATKHNMLLAQEDAAKENVAARTTMLQQYNSTVTANTAEQLNKAQAAQAQAEILQAQMKLRESAANMIGKQAEAQARIIQMEDKRFDNIRQAMGMQLQAAQFQMSLEERKEARKARIQQAQDALEERQANRADRALYRKDREAAEAEKAQAIARFDTNTSIVSGMLGQVGPDGKPLINKFEMVKAIPDAKKRQEWLERVQAADLGGTVNEALSFFNSNANRTVLAKTSPGLLKSAQGLTVALQGYEDAARRPDPANLAAKPPAAKDVPDIAGRMLTAELIASASDPKAKKVLTDKAFDGMFNPYRADHAIMLDQIKGDPKFAALKNNVMVKALETVQAALPPGTLRLTGEDEQRAIGVAILTGAGQKLPPKEIAAQISAYYGTAAKKNLEFYAYDQLGLPPQTRYMVKIPQAGWRNEALTADVINQADAERLVTKTLANASGSLYPTMLLPLFGGDINVVGQ